MLNPDAEDYFRRARQAEDNGDADQAAMFESLYRQSLSRVALPVVEPPPMPKPLTEIAA